MCGITGIFRRAIDPSDPTRLQAMTDSIRHRGPDDHGYLLLDSRDGSFSLGQEIPRKSCDVLLGSRRLAIIDTSAAGRQPMSNEDRDVFVIFNGEIYNHVELMHDLLGRGHRFSSKTDTEVIVHAYEEWGPACVARFNGMWAFALWDQRRRRLFCSRDRFGVKPFYYFLDENAFIFGSEIKAILHGLPWPAAPHHPSIHAFLTERALCRTEETFIARIKHLPAAHSLLVSSGGEKLTRYWDYESQTHRYDYGRPEETFAGLLEDSVRLRLQSDVPVGIALSGGMDSSSIAALAQRQPGQRPIRVFTSEFPGTKHDERRYAELVARRYNMEFHVAGYHPSRLTEDLRRVVWHMEHPALLAQVLPRWQLMGLAARHVKVILEGQGSDELLAGYPHHHFVHWFLDQAQGLTGRDLPRKLTRLATAAIETYRRSGRLPLESVIKTVLPVVNRLAPARKRAHEILSPPFREFAREPHQEPLPERSCGDRLTNALRADHGRRILPHLLMFGDAISMGHSLEPRLPFLDYRLVEFVFGLSSYWKYDGIVTKIILKQALKDVLPPEIIARKDKVGFATPITEWLRQCLDSEVRPLLFSQRARGRGILDPVQLNKLLAKFAAGDLSAAGLIFQALSLEIWFCVFVDGAGLTESSLPS